MQMLFDPFEKEFDFPTFPVKLCDRQSGEFKIIGHKGVDGICIVMLKRNQMDIKLLSVCFTFYQVASKAQSHKRIS